MQIVPGRIVSLLVAWAAVAGAGARAAGGRARRHPQAPLPGDRIRHGRRRRPVPGLSEVVMGTNVAYVDESGRYFLFGRLFDMQDQRDLTAERIEHLSAIDFSASAARGRHHERPRHRCSHPGGVLRPRLPALQDARARARARSTTSPSTPSSTRVEALHPGARDKAIAVWCAPDRPKAWSDLMLRGASDRRLSRAATRSTASSRSARASGSWVRRRFSRATAGERSVLNPRRSSTRGCARPRRGTRRPAR